MKFWRMVLGSLLITTVFLTVGCSGNDGKDVVDTQDVADVTQSTKEQMVSKRVLARWDALIAMDWEKAYDFYSPGSRELKSLAVFMTHMQNAPMVRKRAEIKSVTCEEDLCEVSVVLTYVYMGSMEAMRGQQTTSVLKEKWLLSENSWWFVDSPDAKGFL